MFAPPENCGPSSFATTKQSLPASSAGLGHIDRVECALEVFLRQNLLLPRNLANRSSSLGAFFGNLRGAIITDLWRKAGHHRHRKLHQFAAALLVRCDAPHAFLTENINRVREQPNRLEKIVRHYRHHDVQLEVTVRTGPGD